MLFANDVIKELKPLILIILGKIVYSGR